MTTKVAVLGAAGRMGSQTCLALSGAEDLELVAGLDLGDPLDLLSEHAAEVVVDFTSPATVLANIAGCLDRGVHVVVGTTGFTPERIDEVRGMLTGAPGLGVLIAPNFSVAAVLMMQFAERAAPFFESVEIVELHHPDKTDAPSGTARSTAGRVAAARSAAGVTGSPDATADDDLIARGTDVAGVRIHSVRLRGLIAHQEVLLGAPGETLTIRHDSLDRVSFMPGVLLAVRSVAQRPGLTLGIDTLLDRG